LLFCFLLGIYLTTSAGHTTSNDEEEMYYVTQGLVERHSPALPPAEGRALAIPRGPALGPDGNYYSPYGPLPSVLAIPLYDLGKLAATGVDPRFRDFLTRMAVTAQSAVATAGAATVLALVAVEIGAGAAAGVCLGLIYGLATIAWPYARAFWSEPLAALLLVLAVLFAIRGSRRNSARWWLVASLVLGLGSLARSAMLVCIPAIGVYLLVGALPGAGTPRRGRLIRQAAGFVAGLALPAVMLGAYDLLRFGSVLDTGNGFLNGLTAIRNIFGGSILVGAYGLLLSPGKSILLYAPPVLAGLVAGPTFWRIARGEVVLVAGLTLSQLALVTPLVFWAGDAAWGPRYLVPLVPVLLLPVAAWLAPDARLGAGRTALLAAMIGMGLLVQTLGVAVNPHTYILETGGPDGPGAERRWFDPSASPLVGSAAQLLERLGTYVRPLGPAEAALAGGWYPAEDPSTGLPRWSTGSAELRFRPAVAGTTALELEFSQPEPAGDTRPVPVLELQLDGQNVPLEQWQIGRPRAGDYRLRVELPDLSQAEHRLRLESPTFVPAQLDAGASDQRVLGIDLRAADVLTPTGSAAWVDLPVVPPLPVTAEHQWDRSAFGWFYDPAVPHLVDLWPWYVSQSGLPVRLALLGLLPLVWMYATGWRFVRRLRDLDPAGPDGWLDTWLVATGGLIATSLVLLAVGGGVLIATDRALPAPAPPSGVVSCLDRCASITRAYREVLKREPDVAGLLAYFTSGLDDAGVRADLCRSDEGRRTGCQATATINVRP
jgi:hypothetical protein